AQLSHERPLLVYFWASWCGVCRFTTPDVARLQAAGGNVLTVYYETFAGLAAFFGRDMQVHWHDCFFQVHFLETGKIELQLDDQ
ncbi:thioredoxin domain-containing protein, partial [Serratia sp. ME43]|uniref:thioredoxin domain-containing protein n=1 Tax=Serratia sp. ME43 TaxID=2744256 RepID=UPI0021051F95